jgi:hypothetical protein
MKNLIETKFQKGKSLSCQGKGKNNLRTERKTNLTTLIEGKSMSFAICQSPLTFSLSQADPMAIARIQSPTAYCGKSWDKAATSKWA